MIKKITDTSGLYDVYFEDVDEIVGGVKECYLICTFYYYYFSTLDAAIKFAEKKNYSTIVM